MRHFFFERLTAQGAPIYSGVKDEGYEDIREDVLGAIERAG